MLNRTLSANLNGLNLGTRSLASQANVNIVVATRSLRHAHPQKRKDFMRDADPKAMGGASISIRGPQRILPSASSPSGPASWPYPASPSPRPVVARFVVVAESPVPIGASVSVTSTGRASGAGRSPSRMLAPSFGRPRETMTRAESIPVAIAATGG
jgi:hypothetical protein